MRKGWILMAMFALAIVGGTGCSTMEGLGKDLGKLGKTIEQSAQEEGS